MTKNIQMNYKTSISLFLISIALLISNYGWSQTNLVLNGSADELTFNTSDNADAWDMTPSSTIVDNNGATVASPYKALWNNSTLESWLETNYVTVGSGVDEQPGSSSDGTYNSSGTKTRGVKLYDDGSPTVSASTRRLYQKVAVEAGVSYTFSIDSRAEAENVPSDVFMLNEDISTEAGLENGASDSRVDHYVEITNDFNTSKGSATNNTFTTTTFSFTPSTTTVVIYVRALAAMSSETEVFYDNISLIKTSELSVPDVELETVKVYPNPVSDVLHISTPTAVDHVRIFNIAGNSVANSNDEKIDVSDLTNGVYIVNISIGETSISRSFIKE